VAIDTYRLHNVSRDRSALQEAKEKYKARIVPVLVETVRLSHLATRGWGEIFNESIAVGGDHLSKEISLTNLKHWSSDWL